MVNLDLVFKIAAAGIVVTVLNQVLVKAGRDEQATMVILAGLIAVLLIMIRQIDSLFKTIKLVFGI